MAESGDVEHTWDSTRFWSTGYSSGCGDRGEKKCPQRLKNYCTVGEK